MLRNLKSRLFAFGVDILVSSGGSWWNWPGGLRDFISGWTYGICRPGCFYD